MSAQILLVDDDLNICDTAQDILEDAGYRVATAGSVTEAFNRLQAMAVDVMITDLNLPDGTGLELANQARSQYPKLRIFLMTGEVDGSNPVGLNARSAGLVDDYFVKPVNPPQLLARIQRALS